MNSKKLAIEQKDINALSKIINLVRSFIDKNIIYRDRINYKKIERKFNDLVENQEEKVKLKLFIRILKNLKKIIKGEVKSNLYYLIGGHGGVIIDNIGFCEFDSPLYAIEKLFNKMQLAIKTNIPYNLEISICVLEWLQKNYPNKFSKFLNLYNKGKFEIINPTYSQPYNLIIGPESNIKQFEYGINFLEQFGINPTIYYCSENSLHPQIPQILCGFNVKYGSLKTRLLGSTPTASSPKISWIGLDETSIESIIDLSGLFNGEYWHGTFYRELPNLLFQAVAKPFMDKIVYSSIEDFIIDQPLMEEIWRISQFLNIFGDFELFSDLLEKSDANGKFKYTRDNFQLGDHIFLPSNLFLHNRTSEINLFIAEIIYSVLDNVENGNYDKLFDTLWRDLLLTQNHDSYAVPYIRHGDYCQSQLPKEEFNKIELNKEKIKISELCIRKHKEIQKETKNLIITGLNNILKNFPLKEPVLREDTRKKPSILVFNPTPYQREDIIEIDLKNYEFKSDSDLVLVHKNKKVNFLIGNVKLKMIDQIPGFGYKTYIFQEKEKHDKKLINTNFFYEIILSNNQQAIEIYYKGDKFYSLKFKLDIRYQLELIKKTQNQIQEEYIIVGNNEKLDFKLKILQYSNINRLEFFLESGFLKELMLIPEIKVQKFFIDYPFGIEETKRTKIQTLNFIWLKARNNGIIYIVKNSQKFIINHKDSLIRNILLMKKENYEFAISITNQKIIKNPLSYVNSFNYRLQGIASNYKIADLSESFLTLECEDYINVISLWRRENKVYVRLFNPNNKEQTVLLKGKKAKDTIKELNFRNNLISELKANMITMKPWEIKTIQL
jgi:hypothetical protein